MYFTTNPQTGATEFSRDGERIDIIAWVNEIESRQAPHDHSVLADAINELVERVTALEEVTQFIPRMPELQPIQSKTDNSTATVEIRIKPDDMVWVKYKNNSDTNTLRLDVIMDLWGKLDIEYISPIQPIPATVDGGWIPCKSITLRWPEGDIITYKKACAFNYIPGESKPLPPVEVK
jgi:hypothetical protein